MNRTCLHCAARLERKRFGKRLEDLGVFNAREFCGKSCAALHRADLDAKCARLRERNAAARRAQFAAVRAPGRPKRHAGPAMSPAMAEVLRRMAAGSDLFTGTGGFWVNGDTVYRSEQRATLAALKRRGWVEAVPGTERRFRLTAEGRRIATSEALQRVGAGSAASEGLEAARCGS